MITTEKKRSKTTSNQSRLWLDIRSAARTLDGRIHAPFRYTRWPSHSDDIVLF